MLPFSSLNLTREFTLSLPISPATFTLYSQPSPVIAFNFIVFRQSCCNLSPIVFLVLHYCCLHMPARKLSAPSTNIQISAICINLMSWWLVLMVVLSDLSVGLPVTLVSLSVVFLWRFAIAPVVCLYTHPVVDIPAAIWRFLQLHNYRQTPQSSA